jgi:malonyl-CoA O-methyltransferase
MRDHKYRIQKSFNKAATSYDQHSQAQSVAAKKLLSMVLAHAPVYRCVADIACGTGFSTKLLMQKIDYATLYALDFSSDILNTAQQNCAPCDVEFCMGDYDDFQFARPLNLIFCNMGLQWSLDLSSTLAHLKSQLAPGGIMAFSLPLAGTFSALPEAVRNRFKTVAELEAILSSLTMESVDSEMHHDCYDYPDWLNALQSIKALGANTLLNPPSSKSRGLASPLRQLLRSDAPAMLDYHMGYFLLKSSEGF